MTRNGVSPEWRLVATGPLAGALNMAVDEALLHSFDPESSLPIFRIYGWTPPAFSIGRFQAAGSVLDLDLCRKDGISVVRRITGGGAIYHADELTYAIICRPDHIAGATVKESFRLLTAFLLRFYSQLGLQPQYAVEQVFPRESLGARTPFCFAGKEAYDIVVAGKKIGGNAQRRLKNVIFQHGSVPVVDRTATAARYLKVVPEGLDDAVTSLRQVGVALEEGTLEALMQKAFAEETGVALREEGLTETEQMTARRLLEEKYSSDEWNCGGVQAAACP